MPRYSPPKREEFPTISDFLDARDEYIDGHRDRGVWPEHNTETERYNEFVRSLVNLAEEGRYPRSRPIVTDLGASTGIATNYLCQQVEKETGVMPYVIACDSNYSILEENMEMGNANYYVASRVQETNLPDGISDFTICHALLPFLSKDDVEKSLNEILRITNEEGTTTAQVSVPPQECNVLEGGDEILNYIQNIEMYF